MAHPEDKLSRSRKGKRRSHDFLVKPATSECANCGSTMRPHTVCKSCGYYRGKAVINVDIKQ